MMGQLDWKVVVTVAVTAAAVLNSATEYVDNYTFIYRQPRDHFQYFSLKCSDTVGWATGSASGL